MTETCSSRRRLCRARAEALSLGCNHDDGLFDQPDADALQHPRRYGVTKVAWQT